MIYYYLDLNQIVVLKWNQYKINDFEKEKIINSKITNIYYSKEEILEHIKKYL